MFSDSRFLIVGCLILITCASDQSSYTFAGPTQRTTDGLLALYDFSEIQKSVVADRSSVDDPIDLKIANLHAIRHQSNSLEIREKTILGSQKSPRRLLSAIRRSQSITLEAWIRPRDTKQTGPARIITISTDASHRNITLGQNGDEFEVRFRTTESTDNGLPSMTSIRSQAQRKLTHVVFTRGKNGNARLWINGELNASASMKGSVSNWDNRMRLALANEMDQSRPWRGNFFLVAIYDRAISQDEIARNYLAGANSQAPPRLASQPTDNRAAHFELEVAPILANQCLECHDSLAREGGLDLSKKEAAFDGGDSGPSIVAHRSLDSLLWQSVETDEMPHERPALSSREKQAIKKWIDDGAVWTLPVIDPAIYVHGGKPDVNWLRRLTIAEYIETIRALFDIDITADARRLLPPDVRADGFSNTAYNLVVDLKHIEAYQQLAQIVARQIDARQFRKRFVKKLSFTDNDMGKLIEGLGKRIFRGTLSKRELIALRGIPTTVAATDGGTLDEATTLLVEAMLQSPRFIYRMERQRGADHGTRVDDFELASRMSYIIWGAPPDDMLFKAAENGQLFDEQDIRKQAERMLEDPRAIAQSKRFFADWLNLGRLKNLQPNPNRFPAWDPALADDMRKETLAFFEEVVWQQQRPLTDLLNANVTFVTPRLAQHYDLPADFADVSNSRGELIRFDLSQLASRGGLLTQGSVLTVGGDEASMVTRGLLVMHELLRGVVKDPPACVDTTPVPSKPGLSQRSIAETRIGNETCGGCHRRFEPLAFGLERFDGLGAYHEIDEHGNPLRDDGEIAFPGEATKVRYESTQQLMNLMAASARVKESLTWKLTQFAMGRPLTGADAAVVHSLHQQSMEKGHTYQSTILAIVTSELVTQMQTTE